MRNRMKEVDALQLKLNNTSARTQNAKRISHHKVPINLMDF